MTRSAGTSILGAGLLLALGAACAGEETEGGGGAGGSAAQTYGSSDCGVCVHDACGAAITECGTDPECAAYLSCLDGCPLTTDGGADPSCEQACPRGSGTAAADAIRQLTICRTTGPGASCAACSAGGSGSGSEITDQQCEPSDDPDSCFACELSHCCETYDAYLAVPEAQRYKECVATCLTEGSSDSCYFDCYDQHPGGIQAYAPRLSCLFIYCVGPTACGGQHSACEACFVEQCTDAWAAFYGDAAGFLLFQCTIPCEDDPCFDACLAQYPSAVSLWEAWTTCATTACTAECG